MSKRLEVGCRAVIVAMRAPPPGYYIPTGNALIGKSGILTEGPYTNSVGMPNCWTIEGPEIHQVMVRFSYCRDIPSSVLVRIDDPDVKLDETEDLILERTR